MLAPALHPAITALARSVARSARGRPVPAGNMHLTLAFVGNVASSLLPTLTAVGAALRAAPMTLVLDHLGGFRHAGVAWVGASQPQPELGALAADLVHTLSVAGVECDARAFRPHLTARAALPIACDDDAGRAAGLACRRNYAAALGSGDRGTAVLPDRALPARTGATRLNYTWPVATGRFGSALHSLHDPG